MDETTLWVPAFGLALGIAGHHADASAQSSTLTGSSPPEPVRPPVFDSDVLLSPVAAGSFELMTPRLAEALGRPRFFAHAGLGAALGFTYDLAKEGSPGLLTAPTVPFPASAVPGQGSLTEVETRPLVTTAGVGLALTLDRGGWRIRIKPSLEYLRQEVRVRGLLHRAVGLNPDPNFMRSTDFRLVQLSGERTKAYHGIGPGLEIELDAARIAPLTMTVFASAQVYALLGNRDLVVRGSHSDAMGTETAVWTYRPHPVMYRSGIGVRFRWLPRAGD